MAGYDNLIFGPSIPGPGTNGIMKQDKRLNVNGEVNGDKKRKREEEDTDVETHEKLGRVPKRQCEKAHSKMKKRDACGKL